MQVAAALNVQQFRSAAAASMQNPYMKNVGGGGQSISGKNNLYVNHWNKDTKSILRIVILGTLLS